MNGPVINKNVILKNIYIEEENTNITYYMTLFTLNKINIINIFIVDGEGHIFLYKYFGVSNKTLHWVS
jgi:hypothetical protein